MLNLMWTASLIFSLAGAMAPAEEPPVIGQRVRPFVLTDIRFLPRTVDEFGDGAAYVLIFTTGECPIAQRYLPRIIGLAQDFRELGVHFALVNAGASESMLDVATHMVERGIDFPVLKDFDGSAARALGVTRTPEAVVLDRDLRLIYRGRIDDQYRLGGVKPGSPRDDLKQALLAFLRGDVIERPETPVDGCLLTPALPVPEDAGLTYAEDVAPIVIRHCVECHRPGGVAPFSLLTYEEVARRAEMIDEVVQQQRMPPWYGSRSYGHELVNARGLTDQERRTLRGWVAEGSPPGELDRAPAPPSALPPATSGLAWEIGEPDLVIQQIGETELPADGYVPYKYVVLPHVFLRDTWVQAVEIRSDNEPVLHHANLAFFRVGERYKASNFITGEVPGGDPMELDPGTAVRIPAGSVLGLQCHYVTTGRPESSRISVALRFPRERVRKRLRHRQITDTRFEIPPFAPAHEVSASRRFDRAVIGLGMFSHMHLRGRDMTFRAVFPDGSQEVLLMVPNYSFDWQMSYRWGRDGKRFPAGTRVEVVAHFDNSAFNPYNPDPSQAVRFGLQTYHEMMYGFFFYFLADEDLNVVVDPATGREVGS